MAANDTRMIGFHTPGPELLAAVGNVSVAHGHLEHILKMMIKTLLNVSIQEARAASAFMGPARLRKRIVKLARQELGDGVTLVRIQGLMDRCKHATVARNNVVHSLYAKELDGEPVLGVEDGSWSKQPSITEVNELAQKIDELMREINYERMHGFILQAVLNKSKR